jgi:ribonuclease HII
MEVIIGIDEVGRGPIAGPVAVGAFLIYEKSFIRDVKKFSIPLRDSKQLSKMQREKWFEQITLWQDEGKCAFSICMVDAKEIDRHGISRAIKKALADTLSDLDVGEESLIFLDGSLHAPVQFKNQKTIIKGDETISVISLASIAAKVTRDRHMAKIAKRYPKYGFEQHSGYGTEAHYLAIKKYGTTPVHRMSFLKKVG